MVTEDAPGRTLLEEHGRTDAIARTPAGVRHQPPDHRASRGTDALLYTYAPEGEVSPPGHTEAGRPVQRGEKTSRVRRLSRRQPVGVTTTISSRRTPNRSGR